MSGVGLTELPGEVVSSGSGERATERFRPDLEGLRAVAVLLVLLYHAGLPGFTGGYVGVDVFFVLSGFLITGLIVRELESSGTVRLASFYARRARRLLPAAAVVLAATMLASAILLPPLRVPDIAGDAAAAALYVSNIRFGLMATDYLQSQQAPSPLLHYWSLGVEEQFYLFWPAILLLAARVRWGTRARLAVLMVGIAGASLVLSIIVTQVSEPLAFYLLPTRAWELALGALIARPLPAPSRILAMPPLRWLGRISYSLYLWHWPLLVIPAAMSATPLPLPERVGLAFVAIPIAAASQRWIEEPIRRGRLVGFNPGRGLAFAGALSLSVAASSLLVGSIVALPTARSTASGNPEQQLGQILGTPGVSPEASATELPSASLTPSIVPTTAPGPVPADLQPPLLGARQDLPAVYADGCELGELATQSGPCVYGVPSSRTTVVLFGDSHAAQWFPALDRLAIERSWRLVSLTKALCGAVDHPVWNGNLKRAYPECDAWRASTIQRIANEHPALIVVANSKAASFEIDGRQARADETASGWVAAVASMLRKLGAPPTRVVLIGDTPQMAGDPAVCLSANLDNALACARPRAEAVEWQRLAADRQAAEAAGATFIDPTPWVCPTEPCPVVIGDYLVYLDGGHINATFSTALAPYLGAALGP